MDTTEKKAQRFRSVAYPSFTIRQSTELVRIINQQFGNLSFNSREDIAAQLEMSVGNLLMKLSTATQYQLLEMKSKEGYKPTDLFTSIYKPLSDGEKRKSEIKCLLSPELYIKLINHFGSKQLPAVGGLSILLYRSYKVSEDASAKAAKVFLDNLSDLGLIDGDNRLIIIPDRDMDVNSTELINVNDEPENIRQLPQKVTTTEINYQSIDTAPPIPFFLKGDRIAKLIMPLGFTNEDLEQVIKIISIYKT